LPVAPHMDAVSDDAKLRMELNFIDYVVGPLWERLAQVYPSLGDRILAMRTNREHFLSHASSSQPQAQLQVADEADSS